MLLQQDLHLCRMAAQPGGGRPGKDGAAALYSFLQCAADTDLQFHFAGVRRGDARGQQQLTDPGLLPGTGQPEQTRAKMQSERRDMEL